MLPKAFPHVVGSHSRTNHIGEVGGDMEESARLHASVVH